MVVGPTNDHPRRLRSLLRAVDWVVKAGICDLVILRGREVFEGSYCQTKAATDPNSSMISKARLALLMVDSILP